MTLNWTERGPVGRALRARGFTTRPGGWVAHGTLNRLYMHRALPSGRIELSMNPMNGTGWIRLALFDWSYEAEAAAEHYEQWGRTP